MTCCCVLEAQEKNAAKQAPQSAATRDSQNVASEASMKKNGSQLDASVLKRCEHRPRVCERESERAREREI